MTGTLFKRTMTVTNPNGEVLLGSRADNESGFQVVLKEYEERRLAFRGFCGGIFVVNEDNTFIKTEMWESKALYDQFIEENRAFVRNLVVEYEKYCATTGMTVKREGETVGFNTLTEIEKEAFFTRTFLRP